MRWRGLEPPRGVNPTRPSTLRVYQFRHQRAATIVATLSRLDVDGIRQESYPRQRTYVRPQARRLDADRTAAGDLELPGRLRRPARLSPDRARDRRRGRARVSLDRARAPREPRACGAPEARPDEATRAGVDRPRPPCRRRHRRAVARAAARGRDRR